MSLNRIWRLRALAAVVVWTGFNASALGDEQTEGLDVLRSRMTGLATFVRSADGGPMGGLLPQLGPVAAQPADFFRQHGHWFGVTDADSQLVLTRQETDVLGFRHTTYRQVHKDIPVFSGVLKLHQNANGAFIAANGDFHPIDTGNISEGALPAFKV